MKKQFSLSMATGTAVSCAGISFSRLGRAIFTEMQMKSDRQTRRAPDGTWEWTALFTSAKGK
jgi:hypothetical protein